MPTLWLRFPEDIPFPAHPDAAAKSSLNDIFSTADKSSPWNRALKLLSLAPTHEKLIFWHQDVPYFNSSALVEVISGGAIEALKGPQSGYGFKASYAPRDLWALLACQWKIARFLQCNETVNDALSESIALGLVLQSLMLRLGGDVKHLAVWLAGVEPVPGKHRRTVQQVQAVQLRRTRLSPAWTEIFPPPPPENAEASVVPEFFWDVPASETVSKESASPSGATAWKGLSVCAGQVAGLVVRIPAAEDLALIKQNYNVPLILVFRRARPETTELFEHAAALLFAEGGILSHACTIARERNIPAITALGTDFFNSIHDGKENWLAVDGSTGTVKIIDSSPA